LAWLNHDPESNSSLSIQYIADCFIHAMGL